MSGRTVHSRHRLPRSQDQGQIELNFTYQGSAYPLTYSFDAMDSTSDKALAHFTGTITQADITAGADADFFFLTTGVVRFPNTLVWPKGYTIVTVKGEIKDAAGLTSELWGFLFNTDPIKK